uniref:Uncharacterized protein n=1 Tax=Setaria italica TaxID=4555 RepID=K3YP45_SETIT
MCSCVGVSLSSSRAHPRQPRSNEHRGAAPPQAAQSLRQEVMF